MEPAELPISESHVTIPGGVIPLTAITSVQVVWLPNERAGVAKLITGLGVVIGVLGLLSGFIGLIIAAGGVALVVWGIKWQSKMRPAVSIRTSGSEQFVLLATSPDHARAMVSQISASLPNGQVQQNTYQDNRQVHVHGRDLPPG